MNVWVEAARPKTLGAAISPVLVGTAAADRFIVWRFLAALIVALALQVAVNYANDYFDAMKGVDTPARVGPRRVVAAGLVSPASMRIAIGLSMVVAAAAGGALASIVEPWLFVVGIASFVALLAYSGGPKPYAALGLGEVFVFLFFGLAATVGSAFVQDDRLRLLPVVAAVPVGLLAVAILTVNNLRDIPGDEAAGKRTLAVRLGAAGTKKLYDLLVFASLPTSLLAGGWPVVLAAPLLQKARRLVVFHDDAPTLVRALVATARLQLVASFLLAVGLWIS